MGEYFWVYVRVQNILLSKYSDKIKIKFHSKSNNGAVTDFNSVTLNTFCFCLIDLGIFKIVCSGTYCVKLSPTVLPFRYLSYK